VPVVSHLMYCVKCVDVLETVALFNDDVKLFSSNHEVSPCRVSELCSRKIIRFIVPASTVSVPTGVKEMSVLASSDVDR